MNEQNITEMRGKMLERVGSKLALCCAKAKTGTAGGHPAGPAQGFHGDAAQPREAFQALRQAPRLTAPQRKRW